MKLKLISESLYDGLEDDDEFVEGCVYCGMTPDVTDIINFDGEEVCVDCAEERPMYEWLRHDHDAAMNKLWKLVEDALAKDGHAFGIGDLNLNDQTITLNYEIPTEPAHVRYYSNPHATAGILAARIIKARQAAKNAASTARGW